MDKNISLEGDVTFNGVALHELEARLPQCVAYVTQQDTHFATLTVKETLAFAHQFSGGSLSADAAARHLTGGSPEDNAAAVAAVRAMYAHQPELVTRQLGLQQCEDTLLGDEMLRGVSGGEKKRVTIGEMAFGNRFVALMDEITTGLDSAAAFDIVNMQRSLARQFRKTVVISLLQPSPEIFALFDDVLILNDGYVTYHGPCADVQQYFAGLGFVCPPRRDLADFLVDLGTDQQTQYEVALPSTTTVRGDSHPRLPSEFAELFAQSKSYREVQQQLQAPLDPAHAKDVEDHVLSLPEFHQSFWASTMTLARRQFVVTMRNRAFLRGKAVLVTVMALLYGSAFYQFDFKDVQVGMGVIFLSALYLALTQSPMLPLYYDARRVFYKQRRANFFPTSAFVLSIAASQIPMTLIETIVFGSIIYAMCGLAPSVGAFLTFELVLFTCSLSFAGIYYCVTCFTPNILVGKPLCLVWLLLGVIYAGFIVPYGQFPAYIEWLYWLDPISWGTRAIAISQYRSSRYDVDVYEGTNYKALYNKTMGEYYISFFDIETDKAWIGYGVLYSFAFYVTFMVLATVVLERKRLEAPSNVMLPSKAEEERGSYVVLTTPKGTNSKTNTESAVTVSITSHARHFTPVTVAFQDLWYTVPSPTDKNASMDLLKGVSGFALPGKMTALMGSTGAGKTTLMDVIARRKTGGSMRGKVLLNGYEATDTAIRRATGYCEQIDVHAESATFREAIEFSAFLRQGADVPDEVKHETVQECLELLGLEPIADRMVRGATMEQLKRLTIAVELAAQPSVLFLDEPTSGLDARSAKAIMEGVRKVADTGRTILCTIHQPSTEVFLLFDSVLLLKRGGETVFFGDVGREASRLIEYFERVPGVPRIEEGYNPSTWMLEVIGAGVEHAGAGADQRSAAASTDFVAVFKRSAEWRAAEAVLGREGVSTPSSSVGEIKFDNKRAASNWVQATMVMRRFFRMYWRTPTYNITRVCVGLFLGVLFGLTFFDSKFDTYQGINGGVGTLYVAIIFVGVVAMQSMIVLAAEVRPSFYRERASQTYNAFWYFLGFTVVEIPYVFFSTLLFAAIFFPMAGFTGLSNFFFYWVIMSLLGLVQVYLGQLFAFVLPTAEVAVLASVFVNSVFGLWAGFNPPGSAVPAGYRWLYDSTRSATLCILSGGSCWRIAQSATKRVVLSSRTSRTSLDLSQWRSIWIGSLRFATTTLATIS
ncbi:hypothetical protein PINS_up010018 [Pythium insidiosum]|nr:hypothetical protein PINS_up010018 [Pythium insidiosum]